MALFGPDVAGHWYERGAARFQARAAAIVTGYSGIYTHEQTSFTVFAFADMRREEATAQAGQSSCRINRKRAANSDM
jgi:hypothetical protein